jgi:dTDP-4-amino-4,6-dideoxygalactose transaminase
VPHSIPLYDLPAEVAAGGDEYRAGFERVLASGRFVAGAETAALERELAAELGGGHPVLVRSGTDALLLALRATGVGNGDEVITSAFTFIATAEAILHCGAVPVFADIEPGTLCIAARTVAPLVTPRTRAVLAVHVFGHCCDMDEMVDHCASRGLRLVEDAAQAFGSAWRGRPLGLLGDAGTFSFYPTKNLAGLGNGGAAVARDAQTARTIRSLADHGADQDGRHVRIGYNSRPDEFQAAFLRTSLARFGTAARRRRAIATRYDAGLPASLIRVHGATGSDSNYHQYAILTPEATRLAQHLGSLGIGTGDYYRTPLHREPAIATACRHSGLPDTELACANVLGLPVRPSLTDEEQTAVIAAVCRFFA